MIFIEQPKNSKCDCGYNLIHRLLQIRQLLSNNVIWTIAGVRSIDTSNTSDSNKPDVRVTEMATTSTKGNIFVLTVGLAARRSHWVTILFRIYYHIMIMMIVSHTHLQIHILAPLAHIIFRTNWTISHTNFEYGSCWLKSILNNRAIILYCFSIRSSHK